MPAKVLPPLRKVLWFSCEKVCVTPQSQPCVYEKKKKVCRMLGLMRFWLKYENYMSVIDEVH